MKNILKHSNGSQTLLSNVDDDTNRIFINDEEISPTLWVGSGTYTTTIDGVTVSIGKIPTLSGNIMLQKVSDNNYRLVRQVADPQFSHIGQIIESTTLDTLEKVQDIYGADTIWIQHSGYVLMGATSGVTPNNPVKDGGEDKITPAGSVSQPTFTGTDATLSHTGGAVGNHTLTTLEIPAHTHGSKTLTGSTKPLYWSSQQGKTNGIVSSASDGNKDRIASKGTDFGSTTLTINATHEHSSVGGGQAHNHGFTQPTAHSYKPAGTVSKPSFTGTEHTNLPSNKKVYIWERTA